jgi:signal recognition particle receptor subunit beta
MALLNYLRKEIDAKIVYYGPGLCGKTTNIQFIHQNLQPDQRGNMLSLATDQDVTLFFDFLPIDLEDVVGFKIRFHLFTVPGQVYYGATRRAVLMGADGVIFVADSQIERLEDNLFSIKELEENLRQYGKKLETTPLVIQYNKRDLPNILPVEELNKKINHLAVPHFESVAIDGKGVFESLTMISRMVLKVVKDGAEAHGSAALAYTPSEAKVADASRVEKGISRPESRRVNQEVPAPRPISGPGKDTPGLEPPRPSQNAGPARKLRLEKSDPQIETPRPARIQFSAAAKPEGETSNTGHKSLISRLSGKKKPEPPAEADEEHKKEILTSKQKTRILSFGEPRVTSPNNLEIPLTLEVDGLGKKRSFVIAIKLEELEPKVH